MEAVLSQEAASRRRRPASFLDGGEPAGGGGQRSGNRREAAATNAAEAKKDYTDRNPGVAVAEGTVTPKTMWQCGRSARNLLGNDTPTDRATTILPTTLPLSRTPNRQIDQPPYPPILPETIRKQSETIIKNRKPSNTIYSLSIDHPQTPLRMMIV